MSNINCTTPDCKHMSEGKCSLNTVRKVSEVSQMISEKEAGIVSTCPYFQESESI